MRIKADKIFLAFVMVWCLVSLSPLAMAKDYLYVPCSNYLHIIDCETDTIIKTISYNDYIISAAASADSKRLYLSSWHSVYVVDTEKDVILDRIDFWSDLNRFHVMHGFDVSNDGNFLYLSAMITKKKLNVPRLNVIPPQLIVFDLNKRQIAKSFPMPYNSWDIVALKKDKNHIILLAEDAFKMDIRNGKLEKIMGFLHPDEGQPQLNFAVMANNESPGRQPFYTNPIFTAEDSRILVVDKNNGDIRMVKSSDFLFVYSSVVSEDEKYAYAVMDEVYKVDFKSGKVLAATPVERGTCYGVAITSDGKKLYAGPAGPDLSVYDTDKMELRGTILLKSDGLLMVRISK